jgi:hypothetical protein
LRKEIPRRVVSCCCLWNLSVWLGLDSVDQIREFDSILDEKDGDVVADDIFIALVKN